MEAHQHPGPSLQRPPKSESPSVSSGRPAHMEVGLTLGGGWLLSRLHGLDRYHARHLHALLVCPRTGDVDSGVTRLPRGPHAYQAHFVSVSPSLVGLT